MTGRPKHFSLLVLVIATFLGLVNGGCVGNICPQYCRCMKDQVNCTGRHLTKVPDTLPANVTHLTFGHTGIREFTRTSFKNCALLQALRIHYNRVPLRVGDGTFSSLDTLTCLRLTQCGVDLFIYEDMPLGALDALGALQELYINDNSIRNAAGYRQDLLRNKTRLTTLSLDGIDGVPLPPVFQNLTALQSLWLYGNTTRLQNDTFTNLEDLHLSELRIHGGKLKDIDTMAFAPLKTLTTLILDDNNNLGLSKPGMYRWHSLQYTNLTKLHMNNISRVEGLDLSVNSLPNSSQARIQELQLNNNHLTSITGQLSDHLPTLETLYVDYNHLFPPDLFDKFGLSDMSNMKFLSVNYQDFQWHKSTTLKIHLPPKLETLCWVQAFSGVYRSRLDYIQLRGGAARIKMIDISQNEINRLMGPLHTAGVPKVIEVFNMSYLHFTKMKNNFMFPARNLTIYVIDMSHSDIGNQMHDDRTGDFMAQFQHLKVREMNFTGSNIKFLYSKFFSQISSLQMIILRDNAIHVWEPSLGTLTSLILLDLSYNSMLYPSENFTNDLDKLCQQREKKPCNLQVDLFGNPLEFRCYSISFLKWFLRTKVQLRHSREYTFCQGPHTVTTDNFTSELWRLEIQCSSHYWVLVTACTFTVSLFLLLVAVIIFRHRWDIRYFCLQMTRSQKPYKPLREDPDYEFDAFVVYHQNDYTWVRHQLLVHLEHKIHKPFALCTPDRNWLPGVSKEENIINSISRSRKTIVVVSCSVLGDPWYDFMLQMTWLRGYDICQEVAVVVDLEDVPLDQMSGSLASLRLSHGNREWLEWPRQCRDQQYFWRDLVMALTQARDRPDRRRFEHSLSRS